MTPDSMYMIFEIIERIFTTWYYYAFATAM